MINAIIVNMVPDISDPNVVPMCCFCSQQKNFEGEIITIDLPNYRQLVAINDVCSRECETFRRWCHYMNSTYHKGEHGDLKRLSIMNGQVDLFNP